MGIASAGSLEKMMKQIVGNQKVFGKLVVVTQVDKDYLDCTCHELGDETEIFENVRLNPDKLANFVIYPKIGSICLIDWLDETTGYICQVSEVEGYYIGNTDNSLLTVLLELTTAIKNMTIMTNQGASVKNGIINVADFQAVDDKLKNLFLK